MTLTKGQKKEVLVKVKSIFDLSKSIVLVNFHGLPVSDTTVMRQVLREKQLGYFVAKKTLTRKVLVETKIPGEIPELAGELAIVYDTTGESDDITGPAREIYEFQKKFDNKISILGGIFDSKIVGKEQMMDIALIPGMQGLRGMFANVINSPIQGLVIALNAIAEKKA